MTDRAKPMNNAGEPAKNIPLTRVDDRAKEVEAIIQLYYEDKSIEVLRFATPEELRVSLTASGIEHTPDTVAYCDTFGDEQPDKWGRLYLLNDNDLDSTVHESIHLASGIMAQKGHHSLDLTTEHATNLEEEFCALVGNLVGIINDDLIRRAEVEALEKLDEYMYSDQGVTDIELVQEYVTERLKELRGEQ